MSSNAIAPLVFTGISQYSSDFQTILNRAVQLASLPVQQLQNEQSDIVQQQALASGLEGVTSSLASSIGALGALGASGALVATSSNTSVVSATATGSAVNAFYSISNVTSLAKTASESSLNSYANGNTTQVSTTGQMQLTVGSKQYSITLASGQNNLVGLQSAINGLNAGVTAQILTTSGGNYLSVSANSPGATTLTLVDDPSGAATQWLTNQNQGANTTFSLNGVPVSEPSTSISDVIPGVILNFNGTTTAGQTVSISMSSSRSQLTTALQSLVDNYNSVAQQVNAQIGPGAGKLNGNPIIYQLRTAMLNLVQYRGGSGSIHSLAELGVTIDKTGQMSLDTSVVQGLTDPQLSDGFKFLGSASTGFGNLQNQFTSVSDPITGSIQAQLKQFTSSNQRITDQVSQITSRINIMQSTLQHHLQQADAAVAMLQQQQSAVQAAVQSLNFTTYGQQLLSQQGL